MGNRASSGSRRRLLSQTQDNYNTIEDDNVSLQIYHADLIDFQPKWRQRIALTSILLCEIFGRAACAMLVVWIPQALELNIAALSKEAGESSKEYNDYAKLFISKVAILPLIGLTLSCSCSWIAGILMDSLVQKIHSALISVVLLSGAGSVLVWVIIVVTEQKCSYHHFTNSTLMRCSEDMFDINASCLAIYMNGVIILSILASVTRTALPAFGGDQISERDEVRVFYALFYWCTKFGEVIAAAMCLHHLSLWDSKSTRHYIDRDYNFLPSSYGPFVTTSSALALLTMIIMSCGKLTRHVNPDMSVIKDTFQIWSQSIKRRRERREEDRSCLTVAKISRGGDFPDQAVDDRIQLNKFFVVLLLLIPVAFGTALPELSVDSPSTNQTDTEWLDGKVQQSLDIVILNLVRVGTAFIAVPAIHIISTIMAKCGRAPTFLHRFICGHAAMVAAIVIGIILDASNVDHQVEVVIPSMILHGLCNAFIYTAGFELTFLSAPRSMQGTAMGMFYSMDAVATIIIIAVRQHINRNYCIINSVGAGCMIISVSTLALIENKFQLGLNRV